MAANVRIAAATLTTLVSTSVAMAGSGSFVVTPAQATSVTMAGSGSMQIAAGSQASVVMAGSGQMFVSSSQARVRIAGASMATLGIVGIESWSGFGVLAVTPPGNTNVRVSAANLYTVQQVLTWNGTSWTTPVENASVVMSGANTFGISGGLVGHPVAMTGAGTFAVAGGVASFAFGALEMDGANDFEVSNLPPEIEGGQAWLGAGSFTLSGSLQSFTFLYTPPFDVFRYPLVGGTLPMYGIPVPHTVWRINGVWYSKPVPAIGDLDGADVVIQCPVTVDEDMATQLQASGIGTVTST